MKVHIERKNMQVKLIPFRKNIDFIDVGNLDVGNFRDRSVDEIGFIMLSVTCRPHCSVQLRNSTVNH